jgi:hypothetical protein
VPPFDATAVTALDQPVIRAADFVFLDFLGDPLRATTFGADVTVSGSGDSELDGTYSSVSATVLSLGEIGQKEGGSETMVVELSGILSIDSALLAEIADTSKWRGRPIRRWKRLYDESNAALGAFAPIYTGYMVSVEIVPSPESQSIRLHCENYLALLSQASNRSYLGQKDYDPADTSAQATIGAANGATNGPAALVTPGGGGGLGVRDSFSSQMREF